jgi:dCMP deaminase
MTEESTALARRPTWDEIWVGFAVSLARRGTCLRLQTSCVLVTGTNRVLSTGYNGAPYGRNHCTEVGCQIINNHCVRATHAEINAISLAAKAGIPLLGSVAYCLDRPCAPCLNALVQTGVGAVNFVRSEYDPQVNDDVRSIARDCGITLRRIAEVRY